MSDNYSKHPIADNGRQGQALPQSETKSEQLKSGMSKSMHDGVEVWCDCCSCEAEPYWVEAMQNDDSQD